MAEPLNVLLVVLDGVRADHLSCAGQPRETTPFLDQVAREGLRFSQAFTTAPATLPAVASLLTGVFATTHGASGENPLLSGRHPTMAQQLQAAGYRTAAFCTNPWVSPETGCGRGFDAFFTQRYDNRLAARALSYGRRASDTLLRRADAGARRTDRALRRWLGAGREPFFVLLHYAETQLGAPLPRSYERRLLPEGAAARGRSVLRGGLPSAGGPETALRDEAAMVTALYDGALRYVDTRLREVADFLRARGVWERTLLVVTADHGTHLGEGGIFGHDRGLADALLHVPLLLRCPTRLAQGYVVDELAQTTDILPTILSLSGVAEHGARIAGRALLDDGRPSSGPVFTISERFRAGPAAGPRRGGEADPRPFGVRQRAIRTKREKFIWSSDEANEFYDLVADPAEVWNRIDSESERAEALRRQLFDWLASAEHCVVEAPLEGRAATPRFGRRGAPEPD